MSGLRTAASGLRTAAWCALVLLAMFAVAYVISYAIVLVLDPDQQRNDCIDRYEVCVDTTDGYKPYMPITDE